MLFSDQRKHQISLPSKTPEGGPSNVAFLIHWLCDNLMKDPRRDMFVLEGTVYVSSSNKRASSSSPSSSSFLFFPLLPLSFIFCTGYFCWDDETDDDFTCPIVGRVS